MTVPTSARRIALLALFALAGCAGPDFPDRVSPALEEVALPPRFIPYVADPRTGVVLVETYDDVTGARSAMGLYRYGGSDFEPLAPAPPASVDGGAVHWFEDGAWVGPARWNGATWTSFDARACFEGAHETDGFFLQDARGPNDAYAVTFDGRLCHFDGDTWTPDAPDLSVATLVALTGGELVLTHDQRVLRRVRGGTWEPVDVGGTPAYMTLSADDTATVALESSGETWVEVSVDLAAVRPRTSGAIVGPDGRTWLLEGTTSERERCAYSWWDGETHCSMVTDWVQWVLYEIDGGTRTEVGHLNLDAAVEGSGIWVDLSPMVPDGIALQSNISRTWVHR